MVFVFFERHPLAKLKLMGFVKVATKIGGLWLWVGIISLVTHFCILRQSISHAMLITCALMLNFTIIYCFAGRRDFSIDSKVRLYSGGQTMTVIGINSKSIECRWTDETGTFRSGVFRPHDLLPTANGRSIVEYDGK
jgi:uncharacterized protein YodC (DUF2158 family)